MQVQLDSRFFDLLETLARQQERTVDALVQEAVEQYIRHQQQAAEFDAGIRRIMDEHQRLLDKLAE